MSLENDINKLNSTYRKGTDSHINSLIFRCAELDKPNSDRLINQLKKKLDKFSKGSISQDQWIGLRDTIEEMFPTPPSKAAAEVTPSPGDHGGGVAPDDLQHLEKDISELNNIYGNKTSAYISNLILSCTQLDKSDSDRLINQLQKKLDKFSQGNVSQDKWIELRDTMKEMYSIPPSKAAAEVTPSPGVHGGGVASGSINTTSSGLAAAEAASDVVSSGKGNQPPKTISLIENRPSPLDGNPNGYITKEAIQAGANKNIVFIFGGSNLHWINRGEGGGGQALPTKNEPNVVPITTCFRGSNQTRNDTALQYYHYKVEEILKEFVQLGGSIVFPITADESTINIGTGLAGKDDWAKPGQKFAHHLKVTLENLDRHQNSTKEPIDYFNEAMNDLQMEMQEMTASNANQPPPAHNASNIKKNNISKANGGGRDSDGGKASGGGKASDSGRASDGGGGASDGGKASSGDKASGGSKTSGGGKTSSGGRAGDGGGGANDGGKASGGGRAGDGGGGANDGGGGASDGGKISNKRTAISKSTKTAKAALSTSTNRNSECVKAILRKLANANSSLRSSPEASHNYVQVLFPTEVPSRYTNQDCALGGGKAGIENAKELIDKLFLEDLYKNLKLMMDHWGFILDLENYNVKINPEKSTNTETYVFNPLGNHNQSRITRVLNCLAIFSEAANGTEDQIKLNRIRNSFQKALTQHASFKSLNKKTQEFWEN